MTRVQNKAWQLTMGPAIDTAILYELFSAYSDGCLASGCLDPATGSSDACTETRCSGLFERANASRQLLPNRGFPIVDDSGHMEEYLRHGHMLPHAMPDVGHRHWSPLFALFPGDQVHLHHTPGLTAAAAKTLQRKMDNQGGHTGIAHGIIRCDARNEGDLAASASEGSVT